MSSAHPHRPVGQIGAALAEGAAGLLPASLKTPAAPKSS